MNRINQGLFGAFAASALLLEGCTQKFGINILPTLELVKHPAVVTAETKPEEYLFASKVQLGRLALGQFATQEYALRNTGDFGLEIQSLSVSDPALSEQIKITANCGKLAPNKAEICPVSVKFDPKIVSSFRPSLVAEFKNHLGETKIFRFPIEGEGRSVALLKLKDGGSSSQDDLQSLDFGSVTKDFTGSRRVMVYANTDKYPASPNPLSPATSVSFKFASSPSRFSVSTSNIPSNLTPCNLSSIGKDCYVDIIFSPTQGGNLQVNDTFSVEYNNGSEPAFVSQVSLTGKGTDIVVPPSLAVVGGQAPAFGTVVWSSTSTNAADPGTADLQIQKSGSGPALFQGITFPNFVSLAATGSTCPTTGTNVEISGNCIYKLLYKPTAAGNLSGAIVLSFKQSATGATQTVSVNPTGTAVNPAVLSFRFSSNTVSTKVFQAKTISLEVLNQGGFPASILGVSSSPSVQAFSSTFKNAQNQSCTSIPAGGLCTLELTFNPQTAGSFNTTYSVSYQDGRNSPFPSVSQLVTGIADGNITPPSTPLSSTIDLGNIMIGGKPAEYYGQGTLGFSGAGTLQYIGGAHVAESKFSFYNQGGASAGTFPGIQPGGAGTGPALCQTPFVLSSTQQSCRFFVGVRTLSASDPVISQVGVQFSRNLTVSYFSDGGAPPFSLGTPVETIYTVKATPRNPSVLKFVASSTSLNAASPIQFDPTKKNTESSVKYAYARVDGFFKVSTNSVKIVTGSGTTCDDSLQESTSPFFIGASPSVTNASVLYPGNAYSIPIKFKPSAAQSYTGYKLLVRYDNGLADALAAKKFVCLDLSGSGSDLNTVTANPATSLAFPDQYTLNPPVPDEKTVTISAVGNSVFSPVTVTWPGSGSGPFSVSSNSCSTPITATAPAATTCTIKFKFTPTAFGPFSVPVQLGTLNPITGSGILNLTLTGAAKQKYPALTLSSALLSFDPRIINTVPSQSQIKTVTITNTAPATTGGIAKNFIFSTSSNSAYTIDSAGTTCGAAELQPGSGASSSCVVSIKFAPSAVIQSPGASSILVNYQDGNGNSSGPAPAVNAQLNLALQGSSLIQDPGLGLSPSPLAFGSKTIKLDGTVDPASLEATITNPQTNVVSAKSLTFTGLSAPFSMDVAGSTCTSSTILAPGASCKIKLSFTPTALGSYSQSLAIAYKDLASPENSFSKTLSLTGSVVKGIRVFAGGLKTCLITELEEAICFGSNLKGELGQNQTYNFSDLIVQSMPKINFGSGAKVKKLAPGRNHVCAIVDYPAATPARSGEVTCWGDNQYGQLGRGSVVQLNAPLLANNSIAPIDLGSSASGALKAIDISAGFEHSCAILENGSIKCWGSNGSGQLGTATTGNLGDASGEMGNALPVVAVAGGSAVSISAGSSHTCASFSDGKARCWGDNFYGQIGQPNMDNYGKPTSASNPKIGAMGSLPEIALGSGFNASEVVASFGARTCVRSQTGVLRCFGKTAVENSVGSVSSFAGLLGQCYRRNSDGEGLFACDGISVPSIDVGGKSGDMSALLPVNLGSGAEVKRLAVGLSFTCALLGDSSIKCFGKGNQGQLGRAAGFVSDVPYASNGMPPAASLSASATEWPVDIAAGDNHACYVTNLNKVKCFGSSTSNATGTKKLTGYTTTLQIEAAASAPTVYQVQ